MRSIFASASVLITVLFASVVTADTLLIEIDDRITSNDIDIPEKYADLNATFDSKAEHGDFSMKIILPNFEKYASGKHEVSFNVGNPLNYGPNVDDPKNIVTPGLSVKLETTIFGALEAERERVMQAGSRRPVGMVWNPDETQLADYGTITIEDGVVTGLTYGWVEKDNPGLNSMTRFLVQKKKFPVGMAALKIDVKTFSKPKKFGDLALVAGLNPDVKIEMSDAKMEENSGK
ncbi:MAG: hypothetical protein AAF939_21965 [Planctomycetota bacterium]